MLRQVRLNPESANRKSRIAAKRHKMRKRIPGGSSVAVGRINNSRWSGSFCASCAFLRLSRPPAVTISCSSTPRSAELRMSIVNKPLEANADSASLRRHRSVKAHHEKVRNHRSVAHGSPAASRTFLATQVALPLERPGCGGYCCCNWLGVKRGLGFYFPGKQRSVASQRGHPFNCHALRLGMPCSPGVSHLARLALQDAARLMSSFGTLARSPSSKWAVMQMTQSEPSCK